jgi:hypothetical protein
MHVRPEIDWPEGVKERTHGNKRKEVGLVTNSFEHHRTLDYFF